MCVVIDINTLAAVFTEANAQHAEFSAIKRWIDQRRGVVVYGGTQYKKELSRAERYMRLLRQMRDAGQAVAIVDAAVDAIEDAVLEKTKGTECDDQHVIALLAAARCNLLCSVDRRSFPFVKDRSLYPRGALLPVKIYSSARNENLLGNTDPANLTNVDC